MTHNLRRGTLDRSPGAAAGLPALGDFRVHEKGEAAVVREGVVLCTEFGVSDRGISESHRTISVSFGWRRFVRFPERRVPRKSDLPSVGLMY